MPSFHGISLDGIGISQAAWDRFRRERDFILSRDRGSSRVSLNPAGKNPEDCSGDFGVVPVFAVTVIVEIPMLVDKSRGIRVLGGPCRRLIIHPGSVWKSQVWMGSGCQAGAGTVKR